MSLFPHKWEDCWNYSRSKFALLISYRYQLHFRFSRRTFSTPRKDKQMAIFAQLLKNFNHLETVYPLFLRDYGVSNYYWHCSTSFLRNPSSNYHASYQSLWKASWRTPVVKLVCPQASGQVSTSWWSNIISQCSLRLFPFSHLVLKNHSQLD